jgi:hypothetical protein
MSNESTFAAERVMSAEAFGRLLRTPMLAEEHSVVSGCDWVEIDLDSVFDGNTNALFPSGEQVWLPNAPVLGFSRQSFESLTTTHTQLLSWVDLVITPDLPQAMIDQTLEHLAGNLAASTGLVQLLRQNSDLSVNQGLLLESLMYSTLQHGAEFESWLAQRNTKTKTIQREPVQTEPVIEISRRDDELTITLDRPDKHNAFSAAMRDELCQALYLAQADATIQHITLEGRGASFCSGGDLDEFGTARDSGLAHLTRTTRSPARLIHALADKTTAHLHGACIGAGIEMTAFAGRVTATEETTFALPEVGFGLVPGAGGTVSIPRRIGRHRAALLAISGCAIHAARALDWGLIDDVVN